jgi:hypothetical protein
MATPGFIRSAAIAAGAAAALTLASAGSASADVTLEVTPTEGLSSGDTVTLRGAGLDPAAGYYISTCVAGTSGPTGPTCAGGENMRENAVWVSNSPMAAGAGTPIAEDGTFTAELTVSGSGEGIDCAAQECAVTVFFDHMNGFGTVTEVPVAFEESAAANGAAQESSGHEGGEHGADAAEEGGGSDGWATVAWLIAGGLVVLAIVAIVARVTRKKP